MNGFLQLAIAKSRLCLLKAGDFDESKHPRDEDGKFTQGEALSDQLARQNEREVEVMKKDHVFIWD